MRSLWLIKMKLFWQNGIISPRHSWNRGNNSLLISLASIGVSITLLQFP
jgi:hypothetical protein